MLRQNERYERVDFAVGHGLAGTDFLEDRIGLEVLLELRFDDLLIGFHVDGFQARRTPCKLHLPGILGDIDHLRRKALRPALGTVMHDFAQLNACVLQIGDSYIFPESIRLYAFDDFRLLAHGVQVHLQRCQAVEELDFQIGNLARATKHCDLHPRFEKIERKGVAETTDVSPLHQRCDLLTKSRDSRGGKRPQYRGAR